MANAWKSPSPLKEEPELLEIMSDQLSQRLRIEDNFVWVDLSEVQQLENAVAPAKFDDVSPDLLLNIESSIAQNVGKVVQSGLAADINIGDEGDTEKIYYDEDSDVCEIENGEEMDEVDDWECKIDYERPVNMVKAMYPMPQWLKHKEHDSIRVIKSDNKKPNNEKVNPLLPKIKFDASTTALLEKIIKDRYLGQYNDVIGRGRHSVVLHAIYQSNNRITMPIYNAVKVYKLSKNIVKNKVIFKRVQREFKHLSIVWKHYCKNINHVLCLSCNYVPMPVRAWKNIIIMTFVYEGLAPSIQDLQLQEDEDMLLYWDIVIFMQNCYDLLHVVHGNLCAQNIRYYYSRKRPLFIGWGHSVKTDHPRAPAKLIKDCQFVSEFFSERGIKVKSTKDLFKEITGCTKISRKLLEVINNQDTSLYDIYDRNPNRKYCSPVQPNKSLRFKCN